uniref:RING-type domain-containing protein n=1 Tax=Poecilia reticulata TaxID=8081 RepID=A0A3P9QAG5_POERE
PSLRLFPHALWFLSLNHCCSLLYCCFKTKTRNICCCVNLPEISGLLVLVSSAEFSLYASQIWNKLLENNKTAKTLSSFKSRLETHLYFMQHCLMMVFDQILLLKCATQINMAPLLQTVPSIQLNGNPSRTGCMLSPNPMSTPADCCICRDEFTSPASLPCGHSFCLECIGEYWRISESCQCPLCMAVFPKRPQLKTERTESEAEPLKAGEVPCDVCPSRRAAQNFGCKPGSWSNSWKRRSASCRRGTRSWSSSYRPKTTSTFCRSDLSPQVNSLKKEKHLNGCLS